MEEVDGDGKVEDDGKGVGGKRGEELECGEAKQREQQEGKKRRRRRSATIAGAGARRKCSPRRLTTWPCAVSAPQAEPRIRRHPA